MTAPFDLPDIAAIYRPLGSVDPIADDIPCRLVPNLYCGRGGASGGGYLIWTHWVDFETDVDVRDGCGRVAAGNLITYADGDEVRISFNGRVYSFVVVWVEDRYINTDRTWRRAYLMRDTVNWGS